MDNTFINALVQACKCSQHTSAVQSQPSLPRDFFTYFRVRRELRSDLSLRSRHFHYAAPLAGRFHTRRNITREDYKHMVDYYREPYTTQASITQPEPIGSISPLPAIEEGQMISLETADDIFTHEVRPRSNANEQSNGMHQAIEALSQVLARQDSTQETVFNAYSVLPFPGVSHLPSETRRLLFHRLSVVEIKNQQSSMRFLSVVDDMKAADLPIPKEAWNSAIAFTGRCFVRVTAVEVEGAIRMWKEMEQEAGVQSSSVTFNILFDVATKAGKFVLAEMILQEMVNRRLPLNRFARTGIIYYYGLKGDGQGVRRAYRELVDSGHIVDTVVIDCVMVSLLKAGELPAAYQVYERMKQMFAQKTGVKVPSHGWKEIRDIGHVLEKAELALKGDPGRLQLLQDEQLLAPGLRTYAILIEHHVSVTGELRRVTHLLDDMLSIGVPIHGKIFLKIFKGFAYHGGVRYTSWTKVRLESVWAAFSSALDTQTEDVHLQKWMTVWIIRGFAKCCGRSRALEIWPELKTRWKAEIEELDVVHHLLRDILRPSDVRDNDHDD